MSKSASNYIVALIDITKFSNTQILDLTNANSTALYIPYTNDRFSVEEPDFDMKLEEAFNKHEYELEEIERAENEMDVDSVDTSYFERDETQEDL